MASASILASVVSSDSTCVLGHDGRVGGGLVLGDDGVRVVLLGRRLGGDDLGDGGSLGIGRRPAVDGLDLLGGRLRRLGCLQQLGLPLGERLDRRRCPRLGLLVTLDEALGGGIRDDAGEQAHRADRVVVTRDRVLELVGVGVGVEDADDRDAELVRLVDGEVLALGVDDPDRATGSSSGCGYHRGVFCSLIELALLDEQLLLGEALRGVVEVELLELLHAREALGDRLEVGEQTTEPALVDVGLADARRLLGDGLLRLLLGADEEHGAAVGDRLLDEVVRLVDVGERLLQVDDVDAASARSG